jgi:hypothetical protein
MDLVPESTTSRLYDHADASGMLDSVGRAFHLRFRIAGDTNDLERATAVYRQAIQAHETELSQVYHRSVGRSGLLPTTHKT